MRADNGGQKADAGKDPWHLLPWDAVRGIVQVLRFGAGKYEPRNWERGMDWSRCFSACIRHLTAWFEGEDKDPETGLSHLWHAGCCILFLIAFEARGIGRDDRPKGEMSVRVSEAVSSGKEGVSALQRERQSAAERFRAGR
jgi:hypothetical protein